jgi:hypothetical protein
MSFFAELAAFMRTRKRYWLAPFVVVMLISLGLMLASGSAVTPIIHYFDF